VASVRAHKRPVGAVEEDPGRVEDHRKRQHQREDVVAQTVRRGDREPEHVAADRATRNRLRMSRTMSSIDIELY
jgi:hypothetical protein